MLKKLDIYIIKKFLGTFLTALGLIILIVIVVDVSEKIQRFLDNNIPLYDIITGYYLNFIPYMVNLFSPLFTFIAVIYFTSKLTGNSEIIAMLNGGMSFYRLMIPYIISAILIGSASFYLDNFLIPETSKNMMEFNERYGSKQVRSKTMNNHIKIAPNTYVYIRYWNNENKIGQNFWYEHMTDSSVSYKIKAESIAWDSTEMQWKLSNYTKWTFNGLDEHMTRGNEMDTVLNLSPGDFMWIVNGVAMMNYSEIREYIKSEKEKGSDRVKNYEVEKHRRIASPFSAIILSLIGLCVSCRKSREGMGLHLLIGLIISFSYILFMQISQAFAISGVLPASLSVWIPNIFYAILCFFLIFSTPK